MSTDAWNASSPLAFAPCTDIASEVAEAVWGAEAEAEGHRTTPPGPWMRLEGCVGGSGLTGLLPTRMRDSLTPCFRAIRSTSSSAACSGVCRGGQAVYRLCIGCV